MKTFSMTDVGRRREMNQDYMFTSETAVGKLPNLFLVADGMGGHNAGDVASRMAVLLLGRVLEGAAPSDDLLRGGIYGAADRDRLHSSSMTLNAVSADKKGKRSSGVWQAAFPSAKALSNRYPYLQRQPYLLPVAWVSRFCGYAKENADGNGTAQKAVKIGTERIKLLKEYNIID